MTLLTRAESAPLLPPWHDIGAQIVDQPAHPGSAEDARLTVETARDRAVAAIVLDGYRFDAPYRAALGSTRPPLLVVDDLGGVDLAPGDLLLNPALDASAASYGSHGTLLLGAGYTLLRDEFVVAPANPERQRPDDRVERLVVTVGSGDPGGVTGRILEALASLPPPPGMAITVVVGPENPREAELRALAKDRGLRADFVTAPRSMAPVLALCRRRCLRRGKHRLGAGVRRLPEPPPGARRQPATQRRIPGETRRGPPRRPRARARGTEDAETALGSALRRLLAEPDLRADLAAPRSRALVDGRGRERVLDALAASATSALSSSPSPPPSQSAHAEALMTIAIGTRTLGDGAPCFVVAEIGINHNGDLELARKSIDAARAAGADAVKLQNYRTPRTSSPTAR